MALLGPSAFAKATAHRSAFYFGMWGGSTRRSLGEVGWCEEGNAERRTFCIMSQRVTSVWRQVKPKGVAAAKASLKRASVTRSRPEARAIYSWPG